MTRFRVKKIIFNGHKSKLVYERISKLNDFEIYYTLDNRARYMYIAVKDGKPNVGRKVELKANTYNELIDNILEYKNKDA